MVILSLLDNRAEGLILHLLPRVPSEEHWKVSACPKLGVGDGTSLFSVDGLRQLSVCSLRSLQVLGYSDYTLLPKLQPAEGWLSPSQTPASGKKTTTPLTITNTNS